MTLTHSLPALLDRHRPSDLVASGPTSRTAARLWSDVRAIASRLPASPNAQHGGARSELILVCHDRYLFAASMLAAWERGYVVALPPNAQEATVTSLRKSGTVSTVLHDSSGMAGIDVREIVEQAAGEPESVYAPPAPFAADRRIVVVYTSGTTGAPMACPKTAGQLIGEARVLARTFGVGKGERVLATVPPHHIYGLLFGVLMPLVSGASFSRETVLHAEPLAELIARDDVRVLVSVPAHLRALRVLEEKRIAVLPRVFSSGAPLPADTADDLRARFGWTVTEVLGSSETGGIGWRERPEDAWTPLEGVRVREGEGGRMLIDSPFLDPAVARPYVGGDRVAVHEAGRFQHLGRVDGVLKVGSTRVSIAELEARLLAIPGVVDAAALAVEVGGARGWESWAAVVGEGLTPQSIRAALLPWLDPVVIPRRIRIVAALPRDPTGKLRRTALRPLF
ncbi:MAG: acyl--CoA ligase [Myxococcota bacterium]|nr:acyl--CoA ligase [Myxococcota bacterium]